MSIKPALEQVEAEKRHRLNEKIARGEAVRVPPIVVGHACRAGSEKARRIAALRAAGEKREVIFEDLTEDGSVPISAIATGVPRAARDGEARCENCNCAPTKPMWDARAYQRELEKASEPTPPPMRKPTPELPLPTEWHLVRVMLRAGNGVDDPGQILEGKFGVSDDTVFVEDDQGNAVAAQRLGPNENPAGLAQKLLREKWRNRHPNAPAGFYEADINRKITIH